jgi:methylmalonyl-CoA mutase N-terminal domain/subunit
VQLALRTQQVLAHESGLAEVIDPLAGSYYVETLTAEIETGARALIAEIEERGGMVKAIESGWAQQQIADASWEHQREIETGARVVVGVNRYVEDDPGRVAIHQHVEEVDAERRSALASVRGERDAGAVARALETLRAAAAGEANLVPVLVEAVKAYATMGEICDVLREAFGEYRAVQAY